MDTLSTQVTAAAVVSFLIAFLKKQQWFPWLTAESEKANRLVAIALSGAAALGIHTTFNHATGTLVISGLTLATVTAGFWHWLSQFALTHGWFKATSASDQIYALLKVLIERPPATPAVLVSNGPAVKG
jgi:hypothetical protein